MATKTIKFDDEKEKELLEYLRTLPHGDFSKETKDYWQNRLNHTTEHPKDRPKRNRNLSEMPTVESEILNKLRVMVNKEVSARMQAVKKRIKEE